MRSLKKSTHPSIVRIGAEQLPARAHSSLLPGIDEACAQRPVRDGELTLIQAPVAAGRTSKLIDIAAYNTRYEAIHGDFTVLFATVEDDPAGVVDRIEKSLKLTDDVTRDHVRVARVRTSAELALFVGQVAATDKRKPGLLLVDDLGLLDRDDDQPAAGSDQAAKTAKLLALGSLASAVHGSTGAPFGAFSRLDPTTAALRPMPVVAAVRAPRDGGRWGSSSAVGYADHVYTLDGIVLKTRHPELIRAQRA